MDRTLTKGSSRGDRVLFRDPNLEWRVMSPKRPLPETFVFGHDNHFLYWRVSFLIEITSLQISLYVPPEWRSLPLDIVDAWIGEMRDNPYEDITLGGSKYHWSENALEPYGSDPKTLLIPGKNGLPEIPEMVPYFSTPRYVFSDGTNLPITLNREAPAYMANGAQFIHCYFEITLPPPSGMTVCVPPEWRRLSSNARNEWAQRLANNMASSITLGGVEYQYLVLSDQMHIIPREQMTPILTLTTAGPGNRNS